VDDPGPLLPPAAGRVVARWRRRWTRGDSAAVVVGLLGLLPVLAVAWGGGLYADDIRGLAFFGPEPLLETLLWSGGSHVVPGTHLVLWAHARAAGLSYVPVLVVVPALRALAIFSVWRMLRAVRGPDRWAVVGLVVYAFLPLATSAMAWYVQALTVLPVHLAVAWSVTGLVRWHRGGGAGAAVVPAVAVAFGLCFAEKTAALFVLLPLLCAVGIGRPPGDEHTGSLPRRLRRDLPVLAGLAVVAIGWLATYLGSGGDTGRPVGALETVELLGRAAWSGVLPTLVGGPWSWRPGAVLYESAPYYSVAAAPVAASVAGLLVVTVAAVVSWRLSPARTLLAVAVVVAFFVPSGVLVALARLRQIGEQIAVDLRFWADVVPVLALAVAIAAPPAAAAAAAAAAGSGRKSWRDRGRRVGLALVGLAAVVSVTLSTVGFAQPWQRNPSRDYLDRLSADLRAPREANVYDTEVAEDVLSPIFRPHTGLSFVTGPLPSGTEIGLTDGSMLVPGPHGDLVSAGWREFGATHSGPVDRCGWELRGPDRRTATLGLTSAVDHESDLSLRLDLLAGQPAVLRVDVFDGRRWRPVRRPVGLDAGRTLDAPAGLNGLALRLPLHPVLNLRVTSLGKGVVCVLRASVGVPEVQQ
jgi:hypothetical protein